MTAEEYVALVLDRMPRDTPMLRQIAAELRAHIDERVAQGKPLADVLRQLGDPEKLAEGYVAAIPLVRVSFGERAVAKLIDVAIAALLATPIVALCWWLIPGPVPAVTLCVFELVAACPILMIYTIVSEARSDQTIGKRVMGTLVVREAGTRIGVGQAIVRQLPWLLQIFWIDAFFALFTERHQRAFELLSRTRVVRVPTQEAA